MLVFPGLRPRTLFHGTTAGGLDSLPNVGRGDGTVPDVVQPPVVGLAHHGVQRPYALHARLLERPLHHGVGGPPYTERAGEEDGRLQLTQLPDLGYSRSFPKPLPTYMAAGTRS